MTDYYIDETNGTDNGATTGVDWANAFATYFATDGLRDTIAPTDGDRIFFQHDTGDGAGAGYSETETAGVVWGALGDLAAPVQIFGCKSGTTAEPPVNADFATRSDDLALMRVNANADMDFNLACSIYYSGFQLQAGRDFELGPTGIVGQKLTFYECVLGPWGDNAGAGGGKMFKMGENGAQTTIFELINSDFQWETSTGLASNYIDIRAGAKFIWNGGTLQMDGGTTAITQIFKTIRGINAEINAVDFSQLTAASAFFNLAIMEGGTVCNIKNCQIPDDVNLVTGTRTDDEDFVLTFDAVAEEASLSSGAEIEQSFQYSYAGLAENDVNAVRSGGFDAGQTEGGYSQKLTPAGATFTTKGVSALKSRRLSIYVEGDGTAKTLKVFFARDNKADLKDDEVWISVLSPDEGGESQFINTLSTRTVIGTASALTAETDGDWTGSSFAATPSAQSVSVSISPDYSGVVEAILNYAPESTDPLWVDSLPTVT